MLWFSTSAGWVLQHMFLCKKKERVSQVMSSACPLPLSLPWHRAEQAGSQISVLHGERGDICALILAALFPAKTNRRRSVGARSVRKLPAWTWPASHWSTFFHVRNLISETQPWTIIWSFVYWVILSKYSADLVYVNVPLVEEL